MVAVKSVDELAQLQKGQVYHVADHRGRRSEVGPALLVEILDLPKSRPIYRFIRPSQTLQQGCIDDVSVRESEMQLVDGHVRLVLGMPRFRSYGSMDLGYLAMSGALRENGFDL